MKNIKLEIETESTIYEIEFGQIQIEITGRCNMRCQHCRASNQQQDDMPIEQISKIIRFARKFSQDNKEVVLSGGEPLLHKNFTSVLESVRANGVRFVSLTTNGLVLTKEHLSTIKRLSFDGFSISVSLDSINPTSHDAFRRHPGAFSKANDAIQLIVKSHISGVTASMRCTVQASQIDEMEELVKHAQALGCKRIGFSAVHPVGRAIEHPELWMTCDQKKEFLKRVYQLDEYYTDIRVGTTDPLKCLINKKSNVSMTDERIINGCGAAAVTFNVNADGMMTPCAMLDIPMFNIFPLSIKEITKQYQQNSIVKDMLEMKLKGKCGKCQIKYQCGGCRARAFALKGDYLEEDPHCWL